MDKNFYCKGRAASFLHKLRRSLPATLLLLFAVTFADANGTGFTKQEKNVRKATLLDFFKTIEEEAGYVFIYSKDIQAELKQVVSAHVGAGSGPELLPSLFKNTNLTYQVNDKQIVVKRKSTVTADDPAPRTGQTRHRITGNIVDEFDEPLAGVSVAVYGSTRGVTTDTDGTFSIEVLPTDKLVVSYIGMQEETIEIGSKREFRIIMKEKVDELQEVTVVAFGKQRKESVISSIQTVNTKDLRVPSSNLTTAFAGKMAGVISYQTSGEPGLDNAEFFIRGITTFGAGKVDPLILVDNVEVSTNDLARLHPDDIQSFSILKDATATALYGARGANGVILVTTKEGKEGKTKVAFRFENSFSSPTTTVDMADAISYMNMANEASLTRNPLESLPYSNSKIDNTERGGNPYVYPNIDWMDMLTKNVTVNQRANLNISGGGKISRYYIAASFSQDNGILKVDNRNNFNNNINLKKYLIRSNININLSHSTEAIIRVHGTFDDYSGPIMSGTNMYKSILNVSPVRFPAYFEPDVLHQKYEHILFGGSEGSSYMNPYAESVKGYREESKTVMLAQFELKQDFKQWLEGLNVRLLGNTTRNSAFDLSRSYKPFYYEVGSYDRQTDTYVLTPLNADGSDVGTEYLNYRPGYKSVSSSFYAEGAINYNRTFQKHGVSGMLVGIIRHSISGNESTLFQSLPKRNLGLSGRFTYDFDSRYLAELNFGYNGSEKFDKGHRWGFFPSVGVGWVPSNERFWDGELKRILSKVKIRGTYGLVGNDEISTRRFFYLSEVISGGGRGFRTGYDFNGISRSGMAIRTYANPNIGWEIAYKSNLGLELGLFKDKIDILADFFHERRTNILQSRTDIPSEMGLWDVSQSNVGEASGKGVDVSVDYNHSITPDFWIVGRMNFTYARSTYRYYEEPNYDLMKTPWLSRIDNAISQQWGLVVERLFIDEADIENSARQDFGIYLPGDIKYMDINKDGVINDLDRVPIGHPTTPEVNYGFGFSAGYKHFDFSVFFQGSARSSFWIDASAMSPFVRRSQADENGKSLITETGLAQFIADNYWSELTQNPDAFWPRLSNTVISNNVQRNTRFMENGSFLRFKSAEIGYEFPEKIVRKMHLMNCRFYVSGTNLLLFSNFKLWDVEMGGNGLGYPLQRVFNVGMNVSF
jgi:TonB-linked SusC/RagA family outer membrane protein